MSLKKTSRQWLELFEQKLRNKITTFYNGSLLPSSISKQDLPILTIELLSSLTDEALSGTVKDGERFNFRVTIWINRLDGYNQLGADQDNTSQDSLQDIIEKRNADGDIENDTVRGVIRDNLQISNRLLYNMNVRTNYEDYISGDEFPLARAITEFEAIYRSNR